MANRSLSQSSRSILIYALYVIAFVAILAGIQWVEKGAPDASIKSYFDAFWYAIVTLTTVGYGDLYPVTPAGKILGLVLILMSLGLLSFIIGRITSKFQRYMELKKIGHFGTDFEKHLIIVGWNQRGKMIAQQILAAGQSLVIITDNRNDVDLLHEIFPGEETFVVFGELTSRDVLEKANAGKARSIFINTLDDSEALVYLINLHKWYPKTDLVVAVHNNELRDTFYTAGATYVVSDKDISTKLIASFIFEPDVAKFTEDLMSTATHESAFDIFEFEVNASNPYRNRSYMDTFIELKQSHNAILIGIAKWENGDYQLLKNPDKPVEIQENDHLILITNGVVKKEIERKFGVKEGRD